MKLIIKVSHLQQENDPDGLKTKGRDFAFYLSIDLFLSSKMIKCEKVKNVSAMSAVLKIGVSSNEMAILLKNDLINVVSTLSEYP